MKAINTKLAAFGLAAFVFASCSSSDSPDNGGSTSKVTPDIASVLLQQTDAQQLASRVTNYKSQITKSRAADATLFEGLLDMDAEQPSVPATATDLSTVENLNDLANGGTYKITKGKTIDFRNHSYLKNCTIYVEAGGTMIYDGTSGNNTIYVLGNGNNETESKNGVLDFRGTGLSGSVTSTNDKIYCYGIVRVADRFVVHNGGYFFKSSDLFMKDKYMDIYSNLYVNGSISAKGIRVRNNARVNVINNAKISGENVDIQGGDQIAEFDGGSAVHVGGRFTSPELAIWGGNFTSDCSVRLTKSLQMGSNSVLNANYINVTKENETDADATIKQTGNSKIILGTKGVMTTDSYTTDNTAGQIELAEANGVAVVKTDVFNNTSTDATIKNFSTPLSGSTFLLEFKKTLNNGTEADFQDLAIDASYMHYAKSGVVLSADETADHCGYQMNTTEFNKIPKLDLISSIDYDHVHDISATCVQPSGSNVYVTYHTRGTGHGACVESFNFDGTKATMVSAVQDTDGDLDYNHLLVDGNRLYVVGSSNDKGALFGYFTASSNGTIAATSGFNATWIDKNVSGADANCVVKYGDSFVVGTTRGYEVFNTTDNSQSSVATNGKVKHLVAANGKIYSLSLTSRSENTEASLNGQVEVFGNAAMTTAEGTTNVGEIQPNNGKNTIAIDGTQVYVCKSTKGLVAYNNDGSNLNELWKWEIPVNENKNSVKGYCNGVAYDNNYIYVACGGYGLVILDKQGNFITRRSVSDGNSANYVAVDNGNIYVAYGKSRLQIFKLVNTAN